MYLYAARWTKCLVVLVCRVRMKILTWSQMVVTMMKAQIGKMKIEIHKIKERSVLTRIRDNVEY